MIGLDFSDPMLDVARQRGAGSASTRFLEGDAMKLPFDDALFAAVTVGYGLRNLEDWRVGLAEMVRVARPGGRVLVLDFGKPGNRVLRKLYFLYLRLMVPLFGLVFCGNASAYAYILESLHHYPAQTGVAAAMAVKAHLVVIDVNAGHAIMGDIMVCRSGIDTGARINRIITPKFIQVISNKLQLSATIAHMTLCAGHLQWSGIARAVACPVGMALLAAAKLCPV